MRAINLAIGVYSGTGALLALPTGDIYLEQANPGLGGSSRTWSIKFANGINKVAIAGHGTQATGNQI